MNSINNLWRSAPTNEYLVLVGTNFLANLIKVLDAVKSGKDRYATPMHDEKALPVSGMNEIGAINHINLHCTFRVCDAVAI